MPVLQNAAPQRTPDCANQLFDLTERLLNAHAAAVQAGRTGSGVMPSLGAVLGEQRAVP